MGISRLTGEQQQAIREAYARIPQAKWIAAQTGLHAARVARFLHSEGLPLTRAGSGSCYQRAEDIRRWCSEGLTFSEIGRRIGAKHQDVAEFVRRYQIPHTPHTNTGAGNGRWKGGRTTDKAGYVLVKLPEHPQANRHGYVREHRLVVERMLGRFLELSEVVHHRDGNPANNDPANLEVFASNADHLAETLKGQCPNWTSEGFARIQERWSRLSAERRESSRKASETGDAPKP